MFKVFIIGFFVFFFYHFWFKIVFSLETELEERRVYFMADSSGRVDRINASEANAL